jgi:uncharacterized protein YaaQ
VKLAVCVAHNRDRNRLLDELVRAGFKFTVIGSTGGFLREGNTTILVGIEDDEVQALKDLVCEHCCSREQMVNVVPYEGAPPGAFATDPVTVPVGGAVLFVMPVDEFHRF